MLFRVFNEFLTYQRNLDVKYKKHNRFENMVPKFKTGSWVVERKIAVYTTVPELSSSVVRPISALPRTP